MKDDKLFSRQKQALDLASRRQFDDALEIINRNIESVRGNSLNYFIKGRIHHELLDYESSALAFEKCIKRDKNNKKAKFYLGLVYLTLGNFEKGCRYYEFRHEHETIQKFKSVKSWSPRSKPGKVIIWAEQGIGDEVMFLQFLPFLKNIAHNFTLECDNRLHPIFSQNYPWLNLIPRGIDIELSKFDYHFSIGNLLKFYHKRRSELCSPVLRAGDSKKVNALAERYTSKGLSLTGLSWLSMNADYGLRRSRPVETFCEQLDPSKTAIVNLQYLAPESEIDKIRSMGFHVIDQIDCHQDIPAVFSLISKCKKIITVDNSVAHFAGSLGANTEIWVPALPNWRWGLGVQSSYWYPSVTLQRFE